MFSVLCGCSVIFVVGVCYDFLCDGRVLNGERRPGVKPGCRPGVIRQKSVWRSVVEVGPSVGEVVGVLLWLCRRWCFGEFIPDMLEWLRLSVYWSLIW